MSSENDGGISFALPGPVHDWLGREASRRDESRDDVCRHLVTAAHAVATSDEIEPTDLEDVAAVQAQLDAQREEFVDLLEDVRSRVIQVKRETDGKAPLDHDHSEYADDAAVETLREEVDALESTVDGGFENFEDILDHLLEESAALEERSTLLAKAVVDLREQRDALAERERCREAVEQLKLAANRLGIRTAVCDACDGDVDIALLTEPECPHCATTITDVAEKRSFFGSHTLVTGEPPALEGRVETDLTLESTDVFNAVEANVATGSDESESTESGSPEPASTESFDREPTIR